jgi:hypothetical protein
MPLNKDQQDGFIKVIDFINGPDQFMDISGGAGTGKTYFISKIVDSILKYKNKECKLKRVVITATTNKAAAVISEALPKQITKINTIYSHMELRVSENYRTGNVSIVPTPKWYVHTNELIIIDECSMVNLELFKYLNKGIDSTCKILFVGDKNQLAPVKEAISPIYTRKMKTAYLSKPVRNAGQQALMDLCEQVKQTVLTGVFTRIKEVPGVITLVDGSETRGVLERNFLEENQNRRVLSYTNKRVIEYNNYIRLVRNYTKPYEIGEILSNNSTAETNNKKEKMYTDQTIKVVKIVSEFVDNSIIIGEKFNVINLLVQDITNKSFYDIKVFKDNNDRSTVLNYLSKIKDWGNFFRIKKDYPDLRSISASTVHKAQGSTYDMVLVDLADIGKSTNREQTARMQYVALSRPKTQIFIRGQLPERYFK